MWKLAIAGTRLFLGAIFFTSGMGKLTHGDFIGVIGPTWLAERLAQYGLSFWAQFVAWAQVTIGLLLLSQRFATIGAVMLVPMLANILVITISLQWRGTPYVNAVLLLMNLFLVATDWRRFRPLLGLRAEATESEPVNILTIAGLALGILSPALYPLHRMVTFVCSALAVVLLLAGAWRRAPRMVS